MLRHVLAVMLLAPVLLSGCTAPRGPAHVVVITVDGFPAWLLDDPKAPIPTIRELMRQGAAALSVRVINPSITWPTHTAIVTGCRADRHGVLVNGLIVRQGPNLPVKVEPSHDRGELVQAPTVYDVVHAAGLSTADINWPCTRSADTLDDSLSDAPLAVQYATPRLRKELIDAGILADATENGLWRTSPAGRDELWTAAACHVIRSRKPTLLLFHLLNVDALHHTYGPGSMAGHTALAYLFEGSATFGSDDQAVDSVHLVVFADGDEIQVKSEAGGRFMLIAGAPFGEPIFPYGPFVMNTVEEIEQALRELRNGTFVTQQPQPQP